MDGILLFAHSQQHCSTEIGVIPGVIWFNFNGLAVSDDRMLPRTRF
jgi:hypothetical protein